MERVRNYKLAVFSAKSSKPRGLELSRFCLSSTLETQTFVACFFCSAEISASERKISSLGRNVSQTKIFFESSSEIFLFE